MRHRLMSPRLAALGALREGGLLTPGKLPLLVEFQDAADSFLRQRNREAARLVRRQHLPGDADQLPGSSDHRHVIALAPGDELGLE